MNLRGIRADATYVLKAWFRSGSGLVLSFVIPLLLLLAFGAIFAPTPEELPRLHVVDEDASNASTLLVQDLAGQDALTLTSGRAASTNDLVGWMRAEGVDGFLRIPSGFGAGNATPHLTLAASSNTEASALRSAVEVALLHARAPDDAGAVALGVDGHAPEEPVGYPSFLLPGVIGLSVLTFALPTGFTSISELRHAGLLQRLAVSPLTKREWLFARMLAMTGITLAVSVVLTIAAIVVLDASATVSAWTFLIIAGGTLVFAGLGTLLGLAVKRPETGGAVMNLVVLPVVLLSGSFFDPARMPAFLQWASRLSPLTYVNEGLRADMLYGNTTVAAAHAAMLLGFAAILLIGGERLVRWTDQD